MKTLFACFASVASFAALGALFACGGSSPPPPAAPASTSASASTSAAPPGEIAVGAPAPDFTAKAHDGKEIHLAALKGKPVVIYFYPKDETPGCTAEACAFRDTFTKLEMKGVVLIGVSGDSDESHRAFIEHHHLPFRLVSDPQGRLAALFGVPFHDGIAARQTFVIDANGNVKKIYRDVDVSHHAEEILADVSS